MLLGRPAQPHINKGLGLDHPRRMDGFKETCRPETAAIVESQALMGSSHFVLIPVEFSSMDHLVTLGAPPNKL